MWSFLQCPCLSTDRATINQGNHKEIWERLCRKSHRDHKCTASKCICPHYLSLSVSRYLFVLFVSNTPMSTSIQSWFKLCWFVTLNVHLFPGLLCQIIMGFSNSKTIHRGLECTALHMIGCSSSQPLVGLVTCGTWHCSCAQTGTANTQEATWIEVYRVLLRYFRK